ncbi:MAG: DUF490 domain-containing protein, partial [Rhodoferax sp.]|nr:DUF490 domain-containing protein [Rhodoferax sp.]
LQRGAEGWTWPAEAPLTGRARVELPPVNAWSMLAPPGWRLRGTLDADARIGGTRAAPLWSGNLRAQDLAVRAVAEGIDFSGGTLRARLDGQTLLIDDFTLQGASGAGPAGVLRLNGSLRWLDAPAEGATAALSRWRIDLSASADRLRVSARADRRLVMSGRLSAQLGPSRLSLRGALRADQALFTLPEDSAPALGEDVRVRRANPAPAGSAGTGRTRTSAAATPLPVEVRVALDLGDDFQVRGRGLSTRVAGQVELRNAGERSLQPVLQGEVRAVKGSYRAYGQSLDIESGVLRFSGAYDNPALDVLALRPNLSQKVGVQITGSMLSPVFRLYADPELPDAEKLSWLVLGRSAANGGAEAALLQRAALTLLGGNAAQLPGQLAQALRLDEFSVRGGSTQADGSTSGATVTLGKRLSSEFYVAYERSLAGTLGTLYIFFDLTRRLTLRAQAGQQSAVDLIFTLRYD